MMTRRHSTMAAALGLAGALALAACPGTAWAGPPDHRLDGVWQTDGYGMVLSIRAGRLMAYDRTAVDCRLDQLDAAQLGAPGPGGAVTFASDGVPALTVTPQGRRHAVVALDGSVGHIQLERLAALPPLCTSPPPSTPLTVFDDFWASYAENYPFFALRGVDWQAVRDRYRPLVTPDTTDDQLRQILTDMISPLHDAHTALLYQGSEVYGGLRPGTQVPTPQLRADAQAVVDARLAGPEQAWAGWRLGVGELPGGIGYLRVWSFDNLADGGFQQQAAVLDQALDAVLGRPGLRGLVIDLRLNGGGSDALGLRIASRLTDRPYTAYRKRARNDPSDPRRFTRPEPIAVTPAADGARWTGPVALLTSDRTVSAGETFTQAMMGRIPAPIRIGGTTQGVFSDVLTRTLSPDWTAVLPNEEYLDGRGHSYDATGIPPQLSAPVFTPDELTAHRDSALAAAERVLHEQEGA